MICFERSKARLQSWRSVGTQDLFWIALAPIVTHPRLAHLDDTDKPTALSGRKLSAAHQSFFFSIFKFKTISLRLSKLDTVRVCDLAPSFSAWIS